MTRPFNLRATTVYIMSLFAVLLLVACAGQMAVPQTPAQQAAYMEVTLTGLYNTAASVRPHLSADKYKSLLEQLDTAKIGLELTKAAVLSKSETSVEMLQSLQKVLYALSIELSKMQVDAKGATK